MRFEFNISSLNPSIYDFNEQQNDKRIKILTSKQMLQILTIPVAPVKAGNTTKNLKLAK